MSSKLFTVLDKLADLVNGLGTNKQNKLTAGSGINISNSDVISANVSDVRLDNVSVVSSGIANIAIDADTIVHSSSEAASSPATINADTLGTYAPSHYATQSDLGSKVVSFVQSQTMTTAQKTQARTNIGFNDAANSLIDIKINALDKSDSSVTHQFVISVSETNGIITVTRAQPAASDISGLDSAITTRINNTLVVTDTAVANKFVTQVSQVDGKVVVTRVQPSISNISGTDNLIYFSD